MPIPPPPPPPPLPPPPPPLAVCQSHSEPPKLQCSEGGRRALLADIQKGTRLKKVLQVNDHSAPCLNLTRSGSVANLKQPLWNLPSQGETFRGSTPDLSPSRRTLERTSSLSKSRPVSSYTAPASPTQPIHTSFKPSTIAHSPPFPLSPSFLHTENLSHLNKPPPLPTCPPTPPPPPPPPSQITKPTWLPVQSHPIPMPTIPPLPPPPSFPPPSLSGKLPASFYPVCASPKLVDAKYGNYRDSPPPPPHSHFPASVPPPPLPPPSKAPAVSTFRPAIPVLPPSYPCTAPSRKPPAIPGSAGAGQLAPPPAHSPNSEFSSRTPPPLPPPLPPLPLAPPCSVRNGHLQSFDFESKFQFHPVEDLPPPEVFRPFLRIYPSKENRVSSLPLGMRTHLR